MIESILKPHQREDRVTEPTDREKKQLLNELCAEQDNVCYLCHQGMTRSPHQHRTAVIEHVQPGKMGGCKDWSRANLRAACWGCNFEKGSRRDYVGQSK